LSRFTPKVFDTLGVIVVLDLNVNIEKWLDRTIGNNILFHKKIFINILW